MAETLDRAIIVIGGDEPSESTFAEAEQYEEVFVIARAIPDPCERFVIDDERARAAARARLMHTLARLRAHGVRAHGAIGDESARAARSDAEAMFPAADVVLT